MISCWRICSTREHRLNSAGTRVQPNPHSSRRRRARKKRGSSAVGRHMRCPLRCAGPTAPCGIDAARGAAHLFSGQRGPRGLRRAIFHGRRAARTHAALALSAPVTAPAADFECRRQNRQGRATAGARSDARLARGPGTQTQACLPVRKHACAANRARTRGLAAARTRVCRWRLATRGMSREGGVGPRTPRCLCQAKRRVWAGYFRRVLTGRLRRQAS
ncbi:hypothetical protein PsYK624_103630 [Phanerochaete sordida]|uniref:Uncharacterized protein n=1 Tax=Phanerochaete sordida TaxID=48140 RepID=A0A9P3LGC8_9APHY|nr:hypothetical protein PsYK624_103630 [Phanerochaete sordida]